MEAAARTDFAAVARLSLKAQSTTRRIETGRFAMDIREAASGTMIF